LEEVCHGEHGTQQASAAPVVHARDRRAGRSGRPVDRAGRSDFDLTETAVREWVRQAERDAGTGDGGLSSAERQELAALRRENRQLREDLGVLKRATAFFAKETR
jgi:transposase